MRLGKDEDQSDDVGGLCMTCEKRLLRHTGPLVYGVQNKAADLRIVPRSSRRLLPARNIAGTRQHANRILRGRRPHDAPRDHIARPMIWIAIRIPAWNDD